MIVIPAGQYGFGSPPDEFGSHYNEGYVLEIEFDRPFALGKTEVTFDQWEACVRDKACAPAEDEGLGRGQRPVVNVSWHDANAYIEWLSERTGKDYRLPSEQEIATVLKEPDQTLNIGGAWHTDHSYDQIPAMGSILYAVETPPADLT